jgi:hypothetical protein
MRVMALVDGFNLYHAVDNLGQHHLKWVDLAALTRQFAPAPEHAVVGVQYFSAYATWRPEWMARHQAYVAALQVVGVTAIMGQFQQKPAGCRHCGRTWMAHEEKETDVNIALALVDGAMHDLYDRVLLISADSDLAPAVRMVRRHWPQKDVRIMVPPGRARSYELIQAAGGRGHGRQLRREHLERCLLPAIVIDASTGAVVAHRPARYDPPQR